MTRPTRRRWRRLKRRSTASRQRRRIPAAPIRSGVSTARSIATRFAICSRSTSTPASLLPSDSASFGFDNVTVGNLSPTLLESYVSAAEKISRLAVGRPGLSVGGSTVRIKPDITQEKHIDGLPIGTRGGALVVARVSDQRRIRDHDSPGARSQRAHRRAARAARDRAAARRRAACSVFTIEPICARRRALASDAPSHETSTAI